MVNYSKYKEPSIEGRYITLKKLKYSWSGNLDDSKLSTIGTSVKGERIQGITLGSGNKRVLMWSQMHGNESTTTKAVVDLVNFLLSDDAVAETILDNCTLFVVPILNPDGARGYTRVNANKVDLNRDAKQRTQPESRALRSIFDAFQPDFCFNLHDQRTLFSAGNSANPATVSFLSPASNAEREVTPSRETAMKLIVAMNHKLQSLIPGQIGRYDDAFNDDCVGDAFQMLNVPTVLFEAGHYPEDYEREKTREYIFYALLESLRTIALDKIGDYTTREYFDIPENQKLFYDVLIKNAQVINPNIDSKCQVGIRFKEILDRNKVIFEPEITDVKILKGYYGHKTYDCLNAEDFKSLSSNEKIIDLVRNKKK